MSGLLRAWSQGDSQALDQLVPVVYRELHRLARNYIFNAPATVKTAPDITALNQLSRVDQRKVQIVELRLFAGLSVDETAEVMKTSPRTVMRDWNAAKAWLYRELRGASDGPSALEASR